VADRLHNLDAALAEIQKLAISTTQGEFVRVDDVRRLLAEQRADQVGREISSTFLGPKTMTQAKRQVKQDESIMENFQRQPRNLGKSIPVAPPVNEDVKS
jgi:hypothetical protein